MLEPPEKCGYNGHHSPAGWDQALAPAASLQGDGTRDERPTESRPEADGDLKPLLPWGVPKT